MIGMGNRREVRIRDERIASYMAMDNVPNERVLVTSREPGGLGSRVATRRASAFSTILITYNFNSLWITTITQLMLS